MSLYWNYHNICRSKQREIINVKKKKNLNNARQYKETNIVNSGFLYIFRKENEMFSRFCVLKSWLKIDWGHQFVFYWQGIYFQGKALFFELCSVSESLQVYNCISKLWEGNQSNVIEELTKLISAPLSQTVTLLFRLYWINLNTPQGSAGDGWNWLNCFFQWSCF